MNVPWQWWTGAVLAGVAMMWMLTRNLSAMRTSRSMLDGRRATTLSRVAWMTSAFATWTGPLVGFFALAGIALGLYARRGTITPKTRVAAAMAIENGLVVAVTASLLAGLLYWGAF